MPRKGEAPKRDAVIDALQTIGPMSRAELRSFVVASESGVRKIINTLRTEGLVHICAWDMGRDGVRRKPIAIFAIGAGVDAKPSKLAPRAAQRRYREKRRALRAVRNAVRSGPFGLMVQQLAGSMQ